MAWTDVAASRRQLLGQLSGQLSELARQKAQIEAQRRAQNRDILAGLGEQGLRQLGAQRLQGMEAEAASELAGEKHGYTMEEQRARIAQESEARQAENRQMVGEYYSKLPGWQSQAELDARLQEWKASGLPAEKFWLGHKPVGREEEKTNLEQALNDPVGWAVGMLYTYEDLNNLLDTLQPGEGLPEEHYQKFLNWGRDAVDFQFPNATAAQKGRLKQAIEWVLIRPEAAAGAGAQPEKTTAETIGPILEYGPLAGQALMMTGPLGTAALLRALQLRKQEQARAEAPKSVLESRRGAQEQQAQPGRRSAWDWAQEQLKRIRGR